MRHRILENSPVIWLLILAVSSCGQKPEEPFIKALPASPEGPFIEALPASPKSPSNSNSLPKTPKAPALPVPSSDPLVSLPNPSSPSPVAVPVPMPSPTDTPSLRWNWVGILGNGQSLSVGAAAGPTIFKGASYNNLKLTDSTGAYSTLGANISVVPLTEPIRPPFSGGYPNNINGETFHGMMASTMTELSQTLAKRDLISAHTVSGHGGAGMSGIKKGGTLPSYAGGIFEAKAFQAQAAAEGKTFGYGAVVLTHGETDWATAGYGNMLLQMYDDYNTDLKAITKQTKSIPLLISQQHTFPNSDAGYFFPYISTQTQWLASVDSPEKIIMIGPKYQYAYASDRVHLTAQGYEDFGKKAAEVYYRVLEKMENWKPLQPNAAKVKDVNSLRVTFDIPVPPLKFDSVTAAPHQATNTEWAKGKGFEVLRFDGSRATISSVTIVGDAVDIVIAGGTDTVKTVQYASTQSGGGNTGGTANGRHGLLTDSDDLVKQVNYCVAFVMPVVHVSPETTMLPGRIQDISFAGGRTWSLGDVWTAAGGMNIQFSDKMDKWESMSGAASRLDVARSGAVYYAVSGGGIVAWNNNYAALPALPGNEASFDVGVGGPLGKEVVWATSITGNVSYYNGSAWTSIIGKLFDIDVDPSGYVWGISTNSRVYQWNGSTYIDKGIEALSISIDDDSTVRVVNKLDRNVWHLAPGGTNWVQDTTGGGVERVSSGPNGKFYMTSGERLFRN